MVYVLGEHGCCVAVSVFCNYSIFYTVLKSLAADDRHDRHQLFYKYKWMIMRYFTENQPGVCIFDSDAFKNQRSVLADPFLVYGIFAVFFQEIQL